MKKSIYLVPLFLLLAACSEGFKSTKQLNPITKNGQGFTTGTTTGGSSGSGGGTSGGTSSGSTTGSTGSTSGGDSGGTTSGSTTGASPNSTRIFSPGSGINLSQVQFIVSGSPVGFSRVSRTDGQTVSLTSVGFRPGVFHIDYTHQVQWVDYSVDIGEGTMQAATAWIFFYIDGQWYGTGGERIRPRQTEKSLDLASRVGEDWFYSSAWGVMHNYRPAPGEMVGFMITQGSHRADSNSPLQERSNVVLIPFPADGVDAYNSEIVWSE